AIGLLVKGRVRPAEAAMCGATGFLWIGPYSNSPGGGGARKKLGNRSASCQTVTMSGGCQRVPETNVPSPLANTNLGKGIRFRGLRRNENPVVTQFGEEP